MWIKSIISYLLDKIDKTHHFLREKTQGNFIQRTGAKTKLLMEPNSVHEWPKDLIFAQKAHLITHLNRLKTRAYVSHQNFT